MNSSLPWKRPTDQMPTEDAKVICLVRDFAGQTVIADCEFSKYGPDPKECLFIDGSLNEWEFDQVIRWVYHSELIFDITPNPTAVHSPAALATAVPVGLGACDAAQPACDNFIPSTINHSSTCANCGQKNDKHVPKALAMLPENRIQSAFKKLAERGVQIRNWGFVASTATGKLVYGNNLEIEGFDLNDLLLTASLYVSKHGPAKSVEFEEIAKED